MVLVILRKHGIIFQKKYNGRLTIGTGLTLAYRAESA
jgi:hypothetical protein